MSTFTFFIIEISGHPPIWYINWHKAKHAVLSLHGNKNLLGMTRFVWQSRKGGKAVDFIYNDGQLTDNSFACI